MSWQQPNGNWNANGTTEESLRAARLNAQRNSALGQQQLTLSEQLMLQQLGMAGGTGNAGFQNYPQQSAQTGLFQNQFAQAAMGGGQGLHFANGNAGAYGKLNHFPNQAAALGLNNFTANQQNSLVAILQQQMMNLQQSGGFQNAQQANVISNNLAQALALAQQQSSSTNMRAAASLANNPSAMNYMYRLSQQQALAQNARQMNLGQLTAAQILQQQALQQANQLQAAQQQQMSANMAALLKTGNSAGFGDGQVAGGGSAYANQGMNLVGFNSTGLANSPLASAPLLPILGTDLAKPSQRGMTNDSLAAQVAISSPDVAKQIEALSIGAVGNRTGSVTSLGDLSGRSQAMSPSGLSKDISRTGLSSPTPAQVTLGQQTGTTITSPSAGSKDRDLTTLKTLGQMLAKTGNTVESAVQNGLLGGCNAEDVKVVWEAYVLEVASLKQYDSANKAFQKQGAELVAKRAKSDDPEATKLLLEAAKAPTASVPATLSEAFQCLGMDAYSTPPSTLQPPKASLEKKEEVNENDSGWDGIIENEHDYVPHHLIDEVNTPKDPTNIEIPKEHAFNAENYRFFAADADDALANCALEAEEETALEETEEVGRIDSCRERTKSDENNITAEDDLLDVDSVNRTTEQLETKENPIEEVSTDDLTGAADPDPVSDKTATALA